MHGRGFHGPWGGPFPGGIRPRRIRRFIEPALLLLLHQGPNHGYGLAEGLHRLGLGDYPVDLSGIYRILRDLEDMGMVTSYWDTEHAGGPPRRVYRITPAGEDYLRSWVEELRATEAVLRRFLDAYEAHLGESDTA